MEGISIGILNYNGGGVLKDCISNVVRQDFTCPYQVFVVDNGSTKDISETICRFNGVTVVPADNQHGFITGVNKVFEMATFETVVFLSYDVMLESAGDSLQTVWEMYSRGGEKAIVQPIVLEMDGSIQNAGQWWAWPGYGITLKKPQGEVPMITTTAFMMNKSAFAEIGPFDPLFAPAYYENVDYALRAKRLGYKFYCHDWWRVRHYTSLAFSKRYDKRQIRRYYQINRKKVVAKHYAGLDRKLRLAALTAGDAIREVLP